MLIKNDSSEGYFPIYRKSEMVSIHVSLQNYKKKSTTLNIKTEVLPWKHIPAQFSCLP